jgi:hypothetical protein
MLRFLADLFAADTAARTPANAFRPQVTGMEHRDAPAALSAVAFDPQPEPPSTRTVSVSTTVPGVYVPGPGFLTRG